MEKVLLVLGGITTIILIALVMSLPTMWLWNWLMPIIFKLPEITFWQALGLNVLSAIFFKNSTTNSKK